MPVFCLIFCPLPCPVIWACDTIYNSTSCSLAGSPLFREPITRTNAKNCTITCGNVIPFRGPFTPRRVVSGDPPENW